MLIVTSSSVNEGVTASFLSANDLSGSVNSAMSAVT
jgi:hypothetical protein